MREKAKKKRLPKKEKKFVAEEGKTKNSFTKVLMGGPETRKTGEEKERKDSGGMAKKRYAQRGFRMGAKNATESRSTRMVWGRRTKKRTGKIHVFARCGGRRQKGFGGRKKRSRKKGRRVNLLRKNGKKLVKEKGKKIGIP